MASSAEKERHRREAIEKAWVHPEPLEPRHEPTANERPRTANSIITVLVTQGWTFEEKAATVYDTPTWRTVNKDDATLSYVADPLPIYHLAGYRLDGATVGDFVGVELMYLGGKIARSRLAVKIADATSGARMKASWTDTPAMSLAKTLRENP